MRGLWPASAGATPLRRIPGMNPRLSVRPLLALAPAVLAGTAFAQGAGAPATGAAAPLTGEPRVEQIVREDDQVRIEELRVRGVTRSIQVQTKTTDGSVLRYQILTGDGARDPSEDRRGTGRRVWQLLAF